uniref:Uncharacterized protein n=1 Tax=Coccolithus braarudii TaxID=221442 RepID=A0A7S0PYV6_9EUKA
MAASEPDIAVEVRHLLSMMVSYVASRHAVEECSDLLVELEDYQQQCWTREGRRYQQLRRRQPHSPACGAQTSGPACGSQSPVHLRIRGARDALGCNRPSCLGVGAGAMRPRRIGRARLGAQQSEQRQVEAELSVLHSRMKRLEIGTDLRVSVSVGPAKGTTHSTSKTAISTKPSASVRNMLPAEPVSIFSRLEHASLADAMLPWSPARTHFSAELDNPLTSQVDRPSDRLLQRRLALLGNLQADTVKLERKQASCRSRPGGSVAHLELEQRPSFRV